MPLISDTPPPGPRVSAQASIAVELEWALATADRTDFRRDHTALAAAYERQPELAERVRSFWHRDITMSCRGFIELMVLAHHGGLLFTTDAGAFIERLPDLCAHAPTELTFASETEEDRASVLARLDLLRTSPAVRERYVTLIADVWAAVGDIWERDGRPAVMAAVEARRRLAAGGASWQEVAAGGCSPGLVEELVEHLDPSVELVVVPAYFTHLGLVVDLPGVVVVGVRTETAGAQSRARTEALARRLKALADPTRLAILDALGEGPQTVTELAQTFDLAQPTVSNHVKLLRDAALVASVPDGGRRQLIVRAETVTDLLDHLDTVLRRAAG